VNNKIIFYIHTTKTVLSVKLIHKYIYSLTGIHVDTLCIICTIYRDLYLYLQQGIRTKRHSGLGLLCYT